LAGGVAELADRSQVSRTRAIPPEELETFLAAPHHALRERLLWRMLYETAARSQAAVAKLVKRPAAAALSEELCRSAVREPGPAGPALGIGARRLAGGGGGDAREE